MDFKNGDKDFKEKVQKEFEENQYGKWESKAKEYVNDKEKASELLSDAMKKAESRKKGPLAEIWDKVQLLFGVFKDWIDGRYREIPKGSIIMIIVGLVYFIAPIDIVPDWLAGLGILDDAAVLGFIIRQINDDLERYKAWKRGGNG